MSYLFTKSSPSRWYIKLLLKLVFSSEASSKPYNNKLRDLIGAVSFDEERCIIPTL